LATIERERKLPADSETKREVHQNYASALYNGMIAPLVPFGIRGAIWYQGESNRGRAAQYFELFPAMIADWRRHFGRGDFPFYFVQIAPFAYGGDESHQTALLREAQRLALRIPNTGMACTMDIGEAGDIHPKNKLDVGRRLALWALEQTYGRPLEVWSGPLFKRAEREGDALRVHFDQVGGGLRCQGELTHFELAGADGVWTAAEGRIDGRTILVRASACPEPVAVRYAWGTADMPGLSNAEGLPASSFCSDFCSENWPNLRSGH
jgi:sialate O-acetylesterase